MKDEITDQSQSSYRGIFKATSLFAGVQIYQILISVIKSKFVAILLGPLGVGIQGLYQSALQFVQGLTSLGLSSSAVKDISEVHNTGDEIRLGVMIKSLRVLIWITGLFGMVVVCFLSPLLSKTSFGDNDHVVPFICLSVTLLLDQLCSGQRVMLQGMRHLKQLALASAIGSTLSLFVSVPLYYYIGIRGIVPTLIFNSVTLLLLTFYYTKKLQIPKVRLSIKDALNNGKGMAKLGFAMSISNILVFGCAYVLRWYIREKTGTEAVGLYTAGFTILNTYVGMIFTAIGTDYYPRLASVNNDNRKLCTTVNQQGEIAVLLLAPLLLLCIVFMPLVIRLLYSEQFLDANDFVTIASVGMLFKLGAFLISYQFVAKGESRLFVINETITNIYFLVFNILGYKWCGLEGLGFAFTISYIIYFFQVYCIAHKKYDYTFSTAFRNLFLVQFILLGTCFVVNWSVDTVLGKILCFLLAIISFVIAFKELNQRLQIVSILKSKLK